MYVSQADGAAAVARRFAQALGAGDAGAAARCLTAEGRVLSADGTEVSGREGIVALLSQLTRSDRLLEIYEGRTILAGDTALCLQRWVRRPPSLGGSGGVTTTIARLVVARQGDGAWLVAIAVPWGW
jgi:ketosteroid isomerase-like protein